MTQLPAYLNSFKEQAEEALAKKLVKDTEFSGPTYQVLVTDPLANEDYWVFLQIGGKGQIKDAFCSCDDGHSASGCSHLATAYLSLFGSHSTPLHLRFANSLWNQLCRVFEDRLGDDPLRLIKLQKGHYVYRSGMDKIIFTVKALTTASADYLERIIHKKSHETEENSLKFSNLTPEEIVQWREGKPNSQLRYDLSYWSDIAKWLMHLQEDHRKYTIEFRYSKRDLPNWVQINFEELDIGFYLSEANLPIIIPALNTVESPLKVQNIDNQGISSIIYDKHTGILHIGASKKASGSQEVKKSPFVPAESISVDQWNFIPHQAFYTDEPHVLLENPDLEGDDLSQALTEHHRLISSLIVDCVVHRDPVALSYRLSFDKKWNLHIQSYVFEPGDLVTGNSRLIGNWAYIDDDGFYPIEGKRFDVAEMIIPVQDVSDFVTQNRAWFNTQEGFQTHVKSIEYQLGYQVSASNRLTFVRTLAKSKGESKLQDFGAWVYMREFGFYSKTAGPFNHLLQKGVSLSEEQIPLFLRMNREELALIPHFFTEVCPVSQAKLRIELNDKNNVQITPEFELLPQYKDKKIRVFDDFVYVDDEGFSELHPDLRLPEKFRSMITIEGEEKNLFLTYEIETLRKFSSYFDPRLVKPSKKMLETDLINKAEDKGRGWYRFNFFYKTENGLIPVPAIRQAIQKKQPFIFHPAGLLDLRESEFDWIRRLPKNRFEKELILLSTLEFMRLNAFDPIELINGDQDSQLVFDQLIHLETPEDPDMEGLNSHLRPYQELGVRWLWFLYRHQLSGLLCDDMGLGKTHQAMALLASVTNLFRTYSEGSPYHFLIVCPTSVIYHWQEKLHQFLPGLRVCTFYGTKRSMEAFRDQYDILLTSFGVLRNEKELLSQVSFEVAIIDEIQIAKNQFSQVYSALLKIKSQMKLGLTGTPIENRLRELKSLFDIVLPTYMPSESEYRDFFIKPIEKDQEPKRKALLNRLIHPFTLRRKKEDVLKDLPDKIEEVSYCDLSQQQQALYTEVLEQRRRHLIEELQNEENAIPFLHIFALLSSLKQICDHPAVYLKAPNDYQKYQSGKWELFIELLREARESNQKVVIFSQYLHMLDIIEKYLIEQNIGFASLRGATQNRKEQLKYFNQDPSCEVFVGSLQAAGLGIDLTAGSVVIHYDRWWNAARENQATDRVHRIGQKKGVQVFKLVSKGTFEEKIDAMISRKGRLMEEVIKVDDQNLLKTFSREDLIDLLTLSNLSDAEERSGLTDLE